MAKFKFIGNPQKQFEGANVITFYGLEFVKGEATDIGEDGRIAERLRSNNHFQEVPVVLPASSKGEAVEIQHSLAGPDMVDKVELLAQAKELGIDAKGTWGIQKLQAAIDKALAA